MMPFQQSPTLQAGDTAPDFTLPDANGKPVRLYDLLEARWVVLFFYPKDHTPGCTTEVCSFRDSYQDFQDAGAEVIGISADDNTSHQSFISAHQLPFTLLSDAGNQVRTRYGVPKTLGLLPGRVTYVIAPDKTIRLAYSSQFNAKSHIEHALALLKASQTSPGH